MIESLDHIGIAVKDIEESIDLYKKVFEFTDLHRERVEEQMVEIASFLVGDVKIELTAATGVDSPIAKFIAKRGEGIHHIAFKSNDVNGELLRLEGIGINLIDKEARNGAHQSLIAFLHPKSTGGVLMELCQNSMNK